MSPPPPPPPSLTKPLPNPLSNFILSTFSLFISPNFKPNPNPNPNPKSPIMQSTTKSTTTNRHNHQFPTPQSLSDWLRPRLPSDSFAAWGTRPGTKNIHNLFLELSDGETSLADSTPPVRTVEVVVVRVRDSQNRVLIESYQELSNGDLRSRHRPLSEKMKSGETVDAAVVRAVKEELGSIIRVRVSENHSSNSNSTNFDKCVKFDEIVKIVPNSYTSKVEEKVSVSYPGLPACYVLHTVDAFVDGLPDSEFVTEEEEGDEYRNLAGNEVAVSCKKHYWKWVDSDSDTITG